MPQRYRLPCKYEPRPVPGPRNVPAKIAAKRPVQVISWDECVDRLANSKRRRTDDDFTLVLESGGSFESDLESNLESDSGSDLESSNEEDNEDDDEADPHHAAAALSSPAWAPGNSPVPQHVNQIATTLQLKVHLKSALDFISKRGLVSEAPQDLVPLLMTTHKAHLSLSKSILKNIEERYDALSPHISDNSQPDVTSDSLSKAMYEILPAIETLSHIRRSRDTLKLAYESMFALKASSYGDMDGHGCGRGVRPSDEPADTLLADIIERRLAEGHRWDWTTDLEELSREAKYMMDYSIEPWYPRTRRVLRKKVMG